MYESRHPYASENELRHGIHVYEKEFSRRVSLSFQKLIKCLHSSSTNEAFLTISNVIMSQLPSSLSKESKRVCIFLVIRPLIHGKRNTSDLKNFFIKVRNRNRAVLETRQKMSYEELDEVYNSLMNEYFFPKKKVI